MLLLFLLSTAASAPLRARVIRVTSESAWGSDWPRSRTLVASSFDSLRKQVEHSFGLRLASGPLPFVGLSFVDGAGDLVACGEAEWELCSASTVIAHLNVSLPSGDGTSGSWSVDPGDGFAIRVKLRGPLWDGDLGKANTYVPKHLEANLLYGAQVADAAGQRLTALRDYLNESGGEDGQSTSDDRVVGRKGGRHAEGKREGRVDWEGSAGRAEERQKKVGSDDINVAKEGNNSERSPPLTQREVLVALFVDGKAQYMEQALLLLQSLRALKGYVAVGCIWWKAAYNTCINADCIQTTKPVSRSTGFTMRCNKCPTLVSPSHFEDFP